MKMENSLDEFSDEKEMNCDDIYEQNLEREIWYNFSHRFKIDKPYSINREKHYE